MQTEELVKIKLQYAFHAYELGELNKANSILNELLRFSPGNADAIHLLAIIYATQGNHQFAIKYYEKTLKLCPNDASILSNFGTSLSELGRNNEALKVFQKALKIDSNDSDISFNIANTLCNLKRHEEALSYYEQAIKINPSNFTYYQNYGRALFDLKRYNESIIYCDKALSINQNSLECLINKGEALKELKLFKEALECEKSVLLINPGYAEVWSNIGNILKEIKQYDQAIEHYDQALNLNPEYAKGWFNKGLISHELGLFEEALDFYSRAIKIDPTYHEALTNKGATHHELKQFNDAITHFNKALALKPDYYDASWNKGLSFLIQGDFENGLILYESRFNSESVNKIAGGRLFKGLRWFGSEPIKGKTILVYKEQGFGDFIQFCRYCKLVANMGANVILETPKALVSLVKNLEGVSQVIVEGDEPPHFDYQCPLLSLPLAFKTNLYTIPSDPKYINLENHKDKVYAWKAKLGKKIKPRVGLVWSGNPHHKNDHMRSLSLERLIGFLPTQYEYICLQREIRDSDLRTLELNPQILNFSDDLNDFLETAALIENVDLVISVDTSVAHLSGALGKKTFLMLSYTPDWRWLLDRDDSPWYPTVRLYRQSQVGIWDGVLEKIRFDLNN